MADISPSYPTCAVIKRFINQVARAVHLERMVNLISSPILLFIFRFIQKQQPHALIDTRLRLAWYNVCDDMFSCDRFHTLYVQQFLVRLYLAFRLCRSAEELIPKWFLLLSWRHTRAKKGLFPVNAFVQFDVTTTFIEDPVWLLFVLGAICGFPLWFGFLHSFVRFFVGSGFPPLRFMGV